MAADRPAPVQSGEIQIGQSHRPLQLVGKLTGQKDQGAMGLNARDMVTRLQTMAFGIAEKINDLLLV
jgi:hypothetical protein